MLVTLRFTGKGSGASGVVGATVGAVVAWMVAVDGEGEVLVPVVTGSVSGSGSGSGSAGVVPKLEVCEETSGGATVVTGTQNDAE
jgi:hypothetical protein